MASGHRVGGSCVKPPFNEQMCLIERREATICPLNMTLTARLSPQSKSKVVIKLQNSMFVGHSTTLIIIDFISRVVKKD